MNNFKDLVVWQKSIELTKKIYSATEIFPEKEKFGLTNQLRRAAVSIASNIAEGAGRDSQNEFAHFLAIAKGSSYEVETQVIIANELGYITDEEQTEISNSINEIQKMIAGLKKSIQK
jgi:four helix bundle protein